MKLLIPERIHYKGVDPPPEDWQVQEEPEVAQAPAGKAPPKGKVEAAPVPEVQKSPEIEAADKTIRKFMKLFMTNLITLQNDVNEYRYYST